MDPLDIEITKIWLAAQDLSNVTPEKAKIMFFDALHRIEKQNVERWDQFSIIFACQQPDYQYLAAIFYTQIV